MGSPNGDSPHTNSPNVNSPVGCSPNRGGPTRTGMYTVYEATLKLCSALTQQNGQNHFVRIEKVPQVSKLGP